MPDKLEYILNIYLLYINMLTSAVGTEHPVTDIETGNNYENSSMTSARSESRKHTYKVYIVLHGQGIRASNDSPDIGYVYTGTETGGLASNFFQVPKNTKVFRMVPPGHVFMSHEDINIELRNFFQQPLNKWIQSFKSSTNLNISPSQAAAVKNQSSVDPNDQPYIKSRAIFNKMLQLFETGDEITNERLETDYDTPEDRREFGIWIAPPRQPFGKWAKFSASDNTFINSITGSAKEVPLETIIQIIREEYGKENYFEFYVANCSPVSQDFRNRNPRLVRGDNGRWSRAGEYSTGARSKNFWLNTLFMYNKRIRLYHNGNLKLEQLKNSIPNSETTRKRKRSKYAFPLNDTVWGMMDDEERKDNYKLMNGFLIFYPIWIKEADTQDKKDMIRREMMFYIQCISTPFVQQIRDSPPGYEHIQGISQVTKHNIPIYGYKTKTIKNKKGIRKTRKKEKKQRGTRTVYYTLSEELIKKITAKIKKAQNQDKLEYCRLVDYIYGQRSRDEARFAYTAGVPQRILECESGASEPYNFNGGARRKRRRKTRKKRRRKRKKTRRRKSK